MDSSKNGLHNLYSKIEDMSLIERVTMYDEFLSDIRQRRHAQFARVSLTGSAPEMDVVDQYDGKVRRMIYFGSNDYLNLTNHPRLKQAAISAVERYGAGSGSVPMLGGTFDIQVKLEEKLARFKGCESAIIYTSGFGSNLGTLQCLLKKNDCAIADRLVHASLADGCAGTNIVHFKHNDMDSLESVLAETQEKFKTRIVVIDGVYSMDGDIARLDRIVELAHAHDALVMVDEAHATGVIGANGRGTPEHFNIEGKVDIVAGTLSKAVGSVGGFVCASEKMIQYIRFSSRPFLFSTAMAPATTAAALEALHVIEDEPETRTRLWQNIFHFKKNVLSLGFNINNSETAIFPIVISDDFKVKEMCRRFHQENIYVNQVTFPAVSTKMSRLRFSITAGHTKDHLDRALNLLEDLGREYGVIGSRERTAV